jgi:hypothetical protein
VSNCKSREGEGSENWNPQQTITIYLESRPHKFLNEWVNFEDKSHLWCKEFISEISNWDATVRSDNRIKFDSTIKSNSEIVQTACILAGYRSTYTEFEDNRSVKFNNVHSISILKNRSYVGGQVITKEYVDYNGRVYCVTVPNGAIVIKRNEQVMISGNSGVPADILCGDPYSNDPLIQKGSVEALWDLFGGTINDKGYKVLDPHIGIIYGEAITPEVLNEIFTRLEVKGFSSENVVVGVGSYGIGHHTRDTFGMAIKATYTIVDGKETFIFKDPKTDTSKMKKSQTGKVAVFESEGKLIWQDHLFQYQKDELAGIDLLQEIFVDGKLLRDQTLQDIRSRANASYCKM